MKFRYHKGIRASYEQQAYIFAVSRKYAELDAASRRSIDALLTSAGGIYREALFAHVCRGWSYPAVCMEFSLSEKTLYRCVKKYYESFPKSLKTL